MREEIHGLDGFYATPTGLVAARLLRDRLRAFWPSLPGQSVLGLGYASPFLRLWRAEAARCVALVPPHLPPWRWPRKLPCRTAVAGEDALPFPDLSFDRVLLVHGLETAENARRLLRETWRVLKDDGRLLAVAPNRLSLWAQLERTPFGHGQPYSPGQLERLLVRQMFRVERRGAALAKRRQERADDGGRAAEHVAQTPERRVDDQHLAFAHAQGVEVADQVRQGDEPRRGGVSHAAAR